MSKQYNLSTTEDNGQSVTTSETVTEHPEEILRLMKLAGLENAQVVAEDDSVFEPTPANDKLDLDDYSKKSPESIAKQKKTIQPTLGDNPLEYSLDENEINEALLNDFDEMEEGWTTDKVKQIGGALGKGVWKGTKKLSRLGSKNVSSNFDGKGHVSTTTRYNEDEEEVDEDGAVISTAIKKHKNRKRNYNDDGIAPPSGHHNNTSNRWAESTEEVTEAQSPAQKAAFAKMLAAKNGKKDDTVEEKEETTVEENLQKAQEQINELKEGCSCGCGSDCNCGPECGCGCNAVNEDQDRLRKLAGIQEDGSEKRPSRDPAHDDLDQSFDWPEDGPKIDIDKVGKSKVTVKGPKGKKGSTLNYDDRVQRLARKKDTGKMTSPKGLNLDAKVQF
jgi:hypothetical protein